MAGFSEVARWLRDEEIGRRARIGTPYGPRLICYADLTATGRHLRAVEEWIDRLRPFYANTHTDVSSTGRLMTELRAEARRTIRKAVHAAEDDEVIFVGSGATAAANVLVGMLGLHVSEHGDRPVVFIGPYEHHSNELPWLESTAELVEIGIDSHDRIDVAELKARLREYANRRLKIGSFSAASNVTGLLSDVGNISRALHAGGALAIFDYAAAAPYAPIDMHPPDPAERIDALFLSPHKFIGGPEASGLLVANRDLFRISRPVRPGGGTVDWVGGIAREDVDYVRHLDEREEAGTPAILGDLRAGLAFLVKEKIGPEAILEHEIEIACNATERLSRHPTIRVLGPSGKARLAVLPLEIEGVHHNLASILLDHLFGIQSRSGCSCAGPYGHRLLRLDSVTTAKTRELVRRGVHGIKPGWARLSLPYHASPDEIDFILSAVEFVADNARSFVPSYRIDWRTGTWSHVEWPGPGRPRFELDGHGCGASDASVAETSIPDAQVRSERQGYLAKARELAERLRRQWEESPPHWNPSSGDPAVDDLVWFRYVHSTGL